MTTWASGDELDYYALKVEPGKEMMAQRILVNQQMLAKVPMRSYTPKSRHVSQCLPVQRPSLAGFCFIAFTRESPPPWFELRKIHIIIGVVGMNRVPIRLDHAGLMRLFDDIVFTESQIAEHRRRYVKGDKVRIVDGAFGGFDAEVMEASDADLVVLCYLFGRATPVQVTADRLELVEAAKAA